MESALLGIPLPIIYLSQEKDDKEYVIDGQQRLTAFFSFIDGFYPDGKTFRLNGLRVYPELNGKHFKDLDEKYQDKILNYHIRTITFKKESASELKFDIFVRLNTGAVSLNDQELRNCLYKGPYNELLRKLSGFKDFREMLGLKAAHKRMKDVELVLRFAAFYHSTHLNYKSPMRNFLNAEMEKCQNITEKEALKLEEDFKKAVSIIKSFAGKNSFKRFYIGNARKPDGKWEPKQKFNVAVYDLLFFSFARAEKNTIYRHLDAIKEALIYLMTTDEEFINSIAKDTNNTSKVRYRFDVWEGELQKIVTCDPLQPRCFSRKLKEDLFGKDPTCAICAQRIIDVDDAEIDHIEHYWSGGRTIPENARLTHRYCNRSRGPGKMVDIFDLEQKEKGRNVEKPIGVVEKPELLRIKDKTFKIDKWNEIPIRLAEWVLDQGKEIPEIPNILHPNEKDFTKRSKQLKKLKNGWFIEVGDDRKALIGKGIKLLKAAGIFTEFVLKMRDGRHWTIPVD